MLNHDLVNLLQHHEEHLDHADLGSEPSFPTRGSSSLPRCGCGCGPCGDVCVEVMLLPASDAGRKCVDVIDAVAGQLCRPLFVKCLCRYAERPLRLPERRLTSVPANSGTPYVPFLAKVMPNFFVNFGMTLLKKGHMGYCD